MHFINKPYCKICGYPQDLQLAPEDRCEFCVEGNFFYESARAALIYNNAAKQLILRLKYADDTNLIPTFSKWLLNAGNDLFKDADYLVPVPLHWTRLLQRRYNQAALLVMGMNKLLSTLPKYAPQFLRRSKRTQTQRKKNKKERFKNVQNAFYSPARYKSILQNKTVILVDDVMASGATLNECAKVFMDVGCKSVRVLTLARSLEILEV